MNDNVAPSVAARILVRGVIIGFLIALAARLGWAAGGWMIGA